MCYAAAAASETSPACSVAERGEWRISNDEPGNRRNLWRWLPQRYSDAIIHPPRSATLHAGLVSEAAAAA